MNASRTDLMVNNPNARVERVTHEDCWFSEPCSEKAPDSCPHEPARRKRAELMRGGWSQLVVKKEAGGLRHYLDGQAVHCGQGLELQSVEYKTDDYGDFQAPLQKGTPVRYEASWVDGLNATLHADVGGHEFSARLEPWMRFRWPKRSR